MSKKWPREYERVTPIEEVDPNDSVALTKARNQWVRDRYSHLNSITLLIFISLATPSFFGSSLYLLHIVYMIV